MGKFTDKINPKVVDLSHHNTPTDFKAAYAFGIRGIIHKASQGTGNVDPTYASRRPLIEAADLLHGAYHFGDNSDPVQQWKHFYATAKPTDKTIMALDFEPNGLHTMSLDQARTFLKEGEQALGRKLVLYSGNLIKETLKKPDEFLNAHPLWLAQYSSSYDLPPGWNKYWIRQYTGDAMGPIPHAIQGLGVGLDINTYEGTDEQLMIDWYDIPEAPSAIVSKTLAIGTPQWAHSVVETPAEIVQSNTFIENTSVETPTKSWWNFWS